MSPGAGRGASEEALRLAVAPVGSPEKQMETQVGSSADARCTNWCSSRLALAPTRREVTNHEFRGAGRNVLQERCTGAARSHEFPDEPLDHSKRTTARRTPTGRFSLRASSGETVQRLQRYRRRDGAKKPMSSVSASASAPLRPRWRKSGVPSGSLWIW